jgi:tetratricopeptide (TPR) repeat protein
MLSRLTCLMALVLLLTGCASFIPPINSALDICPSTTDTRNQYFGSPDAEDLVIFIHGLCGDAKTTWTNSKTGFVFPEALAQDFATENHPAYVVAFDYVSRLQGGPSILSIANHLEFQIGQLLRKRSFQRLRIVAHSMGGLVAREYILRHHAQVHPSLKVAGVVLLATPNNGSELTKVGGLVSESRQIRELRHVDDKGNNTYLESLNSDWNREFKSDGHPRHVLVYAGYEEIDMPMIGSVVKMSSAIPYADSVMGFQLDHISIAKPADRDQNTLYTWVKAMLEISLEKTDKKVAGTEMAHQATPTHYPRARSSRDPSCLDYRDDGKSYLGQGDIQRAISYFEKAVELCRIKQDLVVEGFALDGLGEAYFKLEEYDIAIKYHKQALEIIQPGNMEGKQRVLKNLSLAYTSNGDFENASKFLRKLKEIEDQSREKQSRPLVSWEDSRRKIQKNTPRN